MNYEMADPELWDFVDNPIKNVQYLISQVSEGTDNAIFLRKYIQLLQKAEKSVPLLEPSEINPFTDSSCLQLLEIFKEYFCIGILGKVSEEEQPLGNEIILHELINKLEYHANRVIEALRLPDTFMYSVVSCSELFLSFYLSEVYLLIRENLLELKVSGQELIIKEGPLFEDKFKRSWISHTLESMANKSDIEYFVRVSQKHSPAGRISAAEANNIIDYVLDKIFSVKVQYLPSRILDTDAYKLLREGIYISILLECEIVQELTSNWLQKDGFVHESSIELFSRVASRDDAIPFGAASDFIYKAGDTFKRGSLQFKYGLRIFMGRLLEKTKSSNNKDFKGDVGDYFEQDYLLSSIKQMKDFGYEVFNGFKANNNSPTKGYDIDLVLRDNVHDNFCFIQVKYKFSSMPTYFTEQHKQFNDEAFVKGYVNQLLTLKNNMNNQDVRDKLKQAKVDKATPENSYFILLHNIPFLNFYEYNGVYFYEWNLLRNILQHNKVFWRKDGNAGAFVSQMHPRLYNPHEVIDCYFDYSQFGSNLRQEYDIFRRLISIFKIQNTNVYCRHF